MAAMPGEVQILLHPLPESISARGHCHGSVAAVDSTDFRLVELREVFCPKHLINACDFSFQHDSELGNENVPGVSVTALEMDCLHKLENSTSINVFPLFNFSLLFTRLCF